MLWVWVCERGAGVRSMCKCVALGSSRACRDEVGDRAAEREGLLHPCARVSRLPSAAAAARSPPQRGQEKPTREEPPSPRARGDGRRGRPCARQGARWLQGAPRAASAAENCGSIAARDGRESAGRAALAHSADARSSSPRRSSTDPSCARPRSRGRGGAPRPRGPCARRRAGPRTPAYWGAPAFVECCLVEGRASSLSFASLAEVQLRGWMGWVLRWVVVVQ